MAWQRTIAVLGGWFTARAFEKLRIDQFVPATKDGTDAARADMHEQRGAFVAATASEAVRLTARRGANGCASHDELGAVRC